MQEIPANSIVVGVPGRVVKQDNVRIPRTDLDQVHLTDPVKNDISQLKEENKQLKEENDKIKEMLEQILEQGK